MTKTDRPLNTDERKEVDLFVAEGFKRLGLEPATGSDEVQQAILDRLCAEVGLSGHSSEERLSLYLELGCLWGQTLCTVLGWEWSLVSLDENEYYGIVTQNRFPWRSFPYITSKNYWKIRTRTRRVSWFTTC